MQNPIIFHVDVNSAYLSWEAVERQKNGVKGVDLRKVPSAIGGDREKRHGVILAKSTPAKRYNVITGEPILHALQKCPNLIVVPPNHEMYSQYSNELMDLLGEYTHKVEQYSIDEAFMDVTISIPEGITPKKLAIKIKNRIKSDLGFTVNIGVSSNKLLAKMASDFTKPDKVHTLFPEEIETKMWPLPVEELFMVGKSTAKTLRNLGLRTIKDVAEINVEILKSHLGNKVGENIYKNAWGINDEEVEVEKRENKGYGNSVTLAEDIVDYEEACLVLLSLSETVAERLRENKIKGYCIAVEIKDYEFKRQTHQTTLINSTNTTNTIYETSCSLLKRIWDGTPIRLLGIRVTKLTTDEYDQISLFDNPKENKYEKLDNMLDSIRNKYGDNAVQRASLNKEKDK